VQEPFDPALYVPQAAAALGLPLAPENLGDVIGAFAVLARVARPPYSAFPIGQASIDLGGQQLPAAGHLGVFTQPFSFAGLPTLAAPVVQTGALPLGVQIVAAPWREDLAFRVAAAAEERGVLMSPSAIAS
jgi:Asp-tRNA(Asn)/Glu-tRNA(Gln) amidotransferase A subunit family amidase